MEVVSSLWIFMFKDFSNDILKMKFESCFIFHLNITKRTLNQNSYKIGLTSQPIMLICHLNH
jgi:hypothetical protein